MAGDSQGHKFHGNQWVDSLNIKTEDGDQYGYGKGVRVVRLENLGWSKGGGIIHGLPKTREQLERYASHESVSLDGKTIHRTQTVVPVEGIEAHYGGYGYDKGKPELIRDHNGILHVFSGHTRLSVEKLRGKSHADVKVYNLDDKGKLILPKENKRGSIKSALYKRVSSLLIQAASPKYGCLMAILPSLESELPNWAADNIDPNTLAQEGIETETHCTVLYGFNLDFDCYQLIERYSGTGAIKLKLGKLSRFECEKYDVLKFSIDSSRIRALNRSINNSFKSSITPSEHEFNPHVTVAYVKKGTNRHLDGSQFEGRELSVTQLLYSLPEDEGRCVIELGTKREDVVIASEPNDFEPGKKAHAAAQEIYDQAALHFAHSGIITEKNLASAVLLALLLAGEESYAKVSQIIAEPLDVDLEPESLEVQGKDFAESRQPFLENFAKSLAAEIKASRKASKSAGLSDSDTMRALRDVVKKTSKLMTETEATATCGICQQRILQKAGFKTVIWSQLDRPGKRETHELNEQIGEVPIGYKWPNGQQYPGDPEGGPGECVSCLCQLIGGSR